MVKNSMFAKIGDICAKNGSMVILNRSSIDGMAIIKRPIVIISGPEITALRLLSIIL
jgi:hypothetical protein